MPKNKISEFSSNPALNTDVGNIDIAEGCAPSGINNAIRELMAQLKDQQAGLDGDNFTVGGNLTVTGTSTLTGAITATAGVTGNLTGNVTGNVSGNVTGNLTGNVTGNTSGTSANVTGTVLVANGGTGLTTLTANNVILGNGTSTPSFVAPSTTGNVLTSNGTTWQSSPLNTLTLGTEQASTSGTSIDFTSIPSWVKRITIMLNGVSIALGTSPLLIQLGDSGGIETTGYLGTATQSGATTVATSAPTIGLQLTTTNAATYAINAQVTCTLLSASTNTWVLSGVGSAPSGTLTLTSSCSKSLSATLDRIRLTTVSGSQVFDAGTINIMYD